MGRAGRWSGGPRRGDRGGLGDRGPIPGGCGGRTGSGSSPENECTDAGEAGLTGRAERTSGGCYQPTGWSNSYSADVPPGCRAHLANYMFRIAFCAMGVLRYREASVPYHPAGIPGPHRRMAGAPKAGNAHTTRLIHTFSASVKNRKA